MRFGGWKVRSLYRAGSKLDLVGAQEVRWEKGDTERAEDYTFCMEKRMKIISQGLDFI
jgi:hypothetical protein